MTETSVGVVVAGGGAAGHSAVVTLRKEGYTGPLTVLHPEPHAPYNRTLVDKAILQGLLTVEQIALPSLSALDVQELHASVAAVDADACVLILDDGQRLRYTRLVAATGGRARSRDLDPSGSGRLSCIHSVDDATRIRGWFGEDPGAATVTLLGAGFIGAEIASYLAETGATVHLVSRAAVPLAVALGERIARRVTDLHHQHVTTYFGREVTGVFAGHDSVTVSLDDGQCLESDLAVAAYGTTPASGWATGAEDGIAVDDRLRAVGLPRVYGAGSVAVHTDHWAALSCGPLGGRHPSRGARRTDAAARPSRLGGPRPLRAQYRVLADPLPAGDRRIRRRPPRRHRAPAADRKRRGDPHDLPRRQPRPDHRRCRIWTVTP